LADDEKEKADVLFDQFIWQNQREKRADNELPFQKKALKPEFNIHLVSLVRLRLKFSD
jgi:hypothetical protein